MPTRPAKIHRLTCPKCQTVTEVRDSGARPAVQYSNQHNPLIIKPMCGACGHEWEHSLG